VKSLFRKESDYLGQQIKACDAGDPRIRIGEMVTEVTQSRGSQQGIADRMTHNVGI
jgi:hypothetical protein